MRIQLKASSFHYETLPGTPDKYNEVSHWLGEEHSGFNEKRKNEWLAGRYCAREALAKIGVGLEHMPSDSSRAPIWPFGTTGSIAHTDGLVIAMATKRAKALGVDCEKLIPREKVDRLKEAYVRDDEEKLLRLHPVVAPTLVFSAKEALYKNVHPQCGVYFGFQEARILDLNESSFWIELVSDNPSLKEFRKVYHGGFILHEEFIVSWIETL